MACGHARGELMARPSCSPLPTALLPRRLCLAPWAGPERTGARRRSEAAAAGGTGSPLQRAQQGCCCWRRCSHAPCIPATLVQTCKRHMRARACVHSIEQLMQGHPACVGRLAGRRVGGLRAACRHESRGPPSQTLSSLGAPSGLSLAAAWWACRSPCRRRLVPQAAGQLAAGGGGGGANTQGWAGGKARFTRCMQTLPLHLPANARGGRASVHALLLTHFILCPRLTAGSAQAPHKSLHPALARPTTKSRPASAAVPPLARLPACAVHSLSRPPGAHPAALGDIVHPAKPAWTATVSAHAVWGPGGRVASCGVLAYQPQRPLPLPGAGRPPWQATSAWAAPARRVAAQRGVANRAVIGRRLPAQPEPRR